jgi:glycosyltransferase involved in cell wall biosynthesis
MGGYNNALIKALLSLENEVEVMSSDDEALPEGVAFVPSFRLAFDRQRSRFHRVMSYGLGVANAVRKGLSADVIVWHFPHIPPVDWVGMKLLSLSGRRVVMVVHEPFPGGMISIPSWYPRSVAASQIQLVHGPVAQETLMLLLKARQTRVRVAPFGDYEPVEPLTREIAFRVLKLNLPPRQIVCSVIGNLKSGKGTDRILQAVPSLKKIGASLLVAGSPQSNPRLRSLLLDAERHGSVDAVLRRLSLDEERAAYSASDVVLTLYTRGFSSGVIATAHAFGRPVILSDVGDLAKQQTFGDVLLPVDWTATQLAEAVLKVVKAKPRIHPPEELHGPQTSWLEPWRLVASEISGRG